MTREEAYNRIDVIIEKHEVDDVYVTITNHKDYDALRTAREALEQESCEDAISRQAVLELVADYDLSMGQVVRGIHALPSVNPQEPKTDVLDRIRAEIDEQYDRVHPYNISCAEGLEMALEIIDKYKAEMQ